MHLSTFPDNHGSQRLHKNDATSTKDGVLNCSHQENTPRISNTVIDLHKSCDTAFVDHEGAQIIQPQAEREGSDEVKSLKLESGVEAVSAGNAEHCFNRRNRNSLGANPKKLLRDSVSISSIEIPTPYREDMGEADAHSLSMLGLEKEKVMPSAETKALTKHSKRHKEILGTDKKTLKKHCRETRLQKQKSLREEQPTKPLSLSSRKTKDRGAVPQKKSAGKKAADASKPKTGKKKKPFSLFGRRS
ncbi:MAG: hypothetical protein SGILL_009456 [Bacillariaceae sp.]